MRVVVLLFLLGGAFTSAGQDPAEAFGRAVRQSLERSHALYPESATPGSPLSQAILIRLDWLNRNNPAFFSDPEWPVKITAAEAALIGVRMRKEAADEPSPAEPAERRFLGMVTKNFSITGTSFRKGQQIIIEALRDYGKRGVTLVDGQPVTLWLDHIKLVRELARGEGSPLVVKIISARYGVQGTKGYVVSGAVQTGLTPNARGVSEIRASDALLPPATAERLNRTAARTMADPASGAPLSIVLPKFLTVTYDIGGVEKTREAKEGETLVLD